MFAFFVQFGMSFRKNEKKLQTVKSVIAAIAIAFFASGSDTCDQPTSPLFDA